MTNDQQATGAGYLEGWMTRDLLYMQYLNTIVGRCDGKEELCKQIDEWVVQNGKWVKSQLDQNRFNLDQS